ncbi:MAG TPA: TrkH family potassium uptake protein [Clostridia bacterium]|nr:TrkH family potassium uptake protein [Clostridia bacterium]
MKILKIKQTQAIVIGFAAIILIGSILLNLPVSSKDGHSIGFINALFTATSAVCVTGLVVADTFTHWTVFGQIVILLLIQIGGLGLMTLATLFSLALGRRISFKERLLIAESLNQFSPQGMVKLIKDIIVGTLIFEGLGAIILSVRFIGEFGVTNGIFKGIFHAVSAFCNAGFDLMGEKGQFSSLTAYVEDPVVNLTVMLLVIIGGLGFAVWEDIYKTRNFSELRLHTKLVLTVTSILLISGFIFFLVLEYSNARTLQPLSLRGKILASMFQSVTPRTAGFNTLPTGGLTEASKLVTMILMFIGGSPGSTAGGIKTSTVGVLLFSVISVLKGGNDVNVFRKRLEIEVVFRSIAIVILGLIVIMSTTIILSIFGQASLMEYLFESISAFGTVGLSMGVTPKLPGVGKAVLIITMFLGRVGVLTMGMAIALRMQRSEIKLKYPEGKVLVG